MNAILFDTNIILDIALNRKPYVIEAQNLFKLIDENIITAYITATTVTDIYYIAKKRKGHKESIDFIKDLIMVVDILGVDKSVIMDALYADLKDFEDSVQTAAAMLHNLDAILTRNKDDFTNSPVPVMTPSEFLSR